MAPRLRIAPVGSLADVGRLMCLVLLAGLVAGCSPASHPDEVQAPPPTLTTARTWTTVATISQNAKVIDERVTYSVDGLKLAGLLCRPKTGPVHGITVLAHGGFWGIGEVWESLCSSIATSGWAVIMPAYRGEDGSGGKVEVCKGEVDDTMAMLEIAQRQSWALSDQVQAIGMSHGGCVVLRALERGAPFNAAVVISAPVDLKAADDFLWTQFKSGGPDAGQQAATVNTIERAIGATPQEKPKEYTLRSPSAFLPDLTSKKAAVLVLHGTADELVPLKPSCVLASKAGFVSMHLDSKHHLTTATPEGCAHGTPNWRGGTLPGNWPDQRYFIAVDGARHFGLDPKSDAQLIYLAGKFLKAKTPN